MATYDTHINIEIKKALDECSSSLLTESSQLSGSTRMPPFSIFNVLLLYIFLPDHLLVFDGFPVGDFHIYLGKKKIYNVSFFIRP